VRRRIPVSGETVRRWSQELGWEWQRAKVVATDDDPQRGEKLARSRVAFEQRRAGVALFFADEWEINLLPKIGSPWMPQGEHVAVRTPGTTEKRYVAGALDCTTGTIPHCVW
jgi:DDE superfamily endonuclease